MSETGIKARGPDAISVELSMRRTGMSFQRTRMSADRTLMSIIRTSLSLISFGFTIYQVFNKLREAGLVTEGLVRGKSKFPASLTLITALVLLGIGCIAIAGIMWHVGPFS